MIMRHRAPSPGNHPCRYVSAYMFTGSVCVHGGNQIGELDFVKGPVVDLHIKCVKCDKWLNLETVRSHFMKAKAHQEDRDSGSLTTPLLRSWLCFKDGEKIKNHRITIAGGGNPRNALVSAFDKAWAGRGLEDHSGTEEAHVGKDELEAEELPPPMEVEVTEDMELSAGFGPSECDYITFDTRLRLVRCITCDKALTWKLVRAHFVSEHKVRASVLSKWACIKDCDAARSAKKQIPVACRNAWAELQRLKTLRRPTQAASSHLETTDAMEEEGEAEQDVLHMPAPSHHKGLIQQLLYNGMGDDELTEALGSAHCFSDPYDDSGVAAADAEIAALEAEGFLENGDHGDGVEDLGYLSVAFCARTFFLLKSSRDGDVSASHVSCFRLGCIHHGP